MRFPVPDRSTVGATARTPPTAGYAAASNPARRITGLPARLSTAPVPSHCLQVLRLQRKLGELHSGDYNALRRAYDSLCQHVTALEEEARGMVGQLSDFETAAVPPELVAKEVGRSGGSASCRLGTRGS